MGVNFSQIIIPQALIIRQLYKAKNISKQVYNNGNFKMGKALIASQGKHKSWPGVCSSCLFTARCMFGYLMAKKEIWT